MKIGKVIGKNITNAETINGGVQISGDTITITQDMRQAVKDLEAQAQAQAGDPAVKDKVLALSKDLGKQLLVALGANGLASLL